MTTQSDFEMDIYFIRHGESASNVVAGLAAGKNWDAAMTERGHRQSVALGERLKEDGITFDAIYSSSQVRAVETTQGMLKGLGTPDVEFTRVDEIIELQVPSYRGVPRDEVYTPEMQLMREQLGKWFVPGDGESEKAVERRFSVWLEDKILANPELVGNGSKRIAIVAHGISLRCLFHNILEFNDRFIRRFALANTSISRFRFAPTGWFPVSLNDAAHLRGEIGDISWDAPLDITP